VALKLGPKLMKSFSVFLCASDKEKRESRFHGLHGLLHRASSRIEIALTGRDDLFGSISNNRRFQDESVCSYFPHVLRNKFDLETAAPDG
jgi:hypothetical protein